MPYPWADRTAIRSPTGTKQVGLRPLTVPFAARVLGLNNLANNRGTDGYFNAAMVFDIGIESTTQAIPSGVVYAGIQLGDLLPTADYLKVELGATSGGNTLNWDTTIVHGHTMFYCLSDITASAISGTPGPELGNVTRYRWFIHEHSLQGFTGGTTAASLPAVNAVDVEWHTEDPVGPFPYFRLDDIENEHTIVSPSSTPGNPVALQACNPYSSLTTTHPLMKRIVGFKLPVIGGAPELVTIAQSDDPTRIRFNSFRETCLDPLGSDPYAWTFTQVGTNTGSGDDVLAQWQEQPLYPTGDFAVIGDADCTLHTPQITGLPIGFTLHKDFLKAGNDGFFLYPDGDALNTNQVVLLNWDWSTWQHATFHANVGFESLQPYIDHSPVPPKIQVDKFGAWIFYWNQFSYLGTFYDEKWAYAGAGIDTVWIEDEAPGPGDGGGDGGFPPEVDMYDVIYGPGDVAIRAWTFEMDGHQFYVLKLGAAEGTYVYDTRTERWSEWKTGDSVEGWQAHVGLNWDRRAVGGDWITGTIWSIDPTLHEDDDARITRVCVGGLPQRLRNAMACNAVMLTGSRTVETLAGVTIQLRTSDNYGLSWNNHGQLTLPTDGSYDTEITWQSLGTIHAPGRIFEITDTGAAYRVDGLDMW